MSGASPGAAWQRPEIAGEFLDRRQAVLPLIDVQEDLVRRIFRRRGQDVARVLDVGAGDGAMTELMCSLYPRAQAVLVDFSEPMLARIERRLGDGGWRAVRADLSMSGWRQELPDGRYDAAVSSYAIHHLTTERKRALFVELFELLEPGGMFVNVDVVAIGEPLAGLFDEQMAANDAAMREAAGEPPHEHVESDLFDDHEEDRPDPADSQLLWLREAGFKDVDLHFKWAEGAIFGAVKPS
jgi:tRNA (cmo5U34)-methyltransferase